MTRTTSRGTALVAEDEVALAERVVELVVDRALAAIAARGRFDLALAGGSTPKMAYARLASAQYASAVDWKRVRFFFGDERCVPPDDDESNFKMASQALLVPLGVVAGAVFRMRGEDPPEQAARDYAGKLSRELAGDSTPVLDLVLLGMGPDGHTASLFPGSDPFEGDELLVRAPYVPKVSAHRITLTPRTLNAAREVVVATAGTAKAAALAAVLEGPYEPATYPIQVLDPRDGRLTWLVDRAAAALLGATHLS